MELLEKVWPQWKIVKNIGEGSFGKVYEIERKDVGGCYKAALKVISIPQSESEIHSILSEGMDMKSVPQYFQNMMEQIVKEFTMMEKLKGNTNIVSYEDHEVLKHEDGIGWDILIRMELLAPLSSYMIEKSMSETDIVKLGIDICKALELCQRYNIIHRDIKPENIFISSLGDYKLGDFGVARTAEKTMSGLSKKGTFTYMAPEVYRGEAYNASVDLYSLGIVLYRLANDCRAPFLPPVPQVITFNDRETAQLRRMEGEEFPNPSKGSEELTAIIRKATAYRAKERYASPSQMRFDLEALLKGEKIKYAFMECKPVDMEADRLRKNDNDVDKTLLLQEGGQRIPEDKTQFLFEEHPGKIPEVKAMPDEKALIKASAPQGVKSKPIEKKSVKKSSTAATVGKVIFGSALGMIALVVITVLCILALIGLFFMFILFYEDPSIATNTTATNLYVFEQSIFGEVYNDML